MFFEKYKIQKGKYNMNIRIGWTQLISFSSNVRYILKESCKRDNLDWETSEI